MSNDINPFPIKLTDEAAAALTESLYWLASVCEEKYYPQILRHAAAVCRSYEADQNNTPDKTGD